MTGTAKRQKGAAVGAAPWLPAPPSPTMAAGAGAGCTPRGEGRTAGGPQWGAEAWVPTQAPGQPLCGLQELTPLLCLGYEAEAKFQAEKFVL